MVRVIHGTEDIHNLIQDIAKDVFCIEEEIVVENGDAPKDENHGVWSMNLSTKLFADDHKSIKVSNLEIPQASDW